MHNFIKTILMKNHTNSLATPNIYLRKLYLGFNAVLICYLLSCSTLNAQAVSFAISSPASVIRGSSITVTATVTNPKKNTTYNLSVTCTSGCTSTTPQTFALVIGDVDLPSASQPFTFSSSSTPPPGTASFTATANGGPGSGCTPCNAASSTVLPVELAFFKGELGQKELVTLKWQTLSEKNNDRFSIEHSTEGEVFNRIGEIDGAGTTTEPQDYTFTHHTPSAGTNYYRLKQLDFDGTFEYSKVIAINAPGSNDVFAFPNPAKDKLTLQYDYSKGSSNIQLFDALGRRLNANIGGYAGNYEIQLPAGLAKGTYWLKVERGGKVQTVAVVKE